jgi:hypothetical protein
MRGKVDHPLGRSPEGLLAERTLERLGARVHPLMDTLNMQGEIVKHMTFFLVDLGPTIKSDRILIYNDQKFSYNLAEKSLVLVLASYVRTVQSNLVVVK